MSYRVKGPELYHNGKRIHLNGVNWTGAEQVNNLVPYGPWGSKSYRDRVKDIRALGDNAVRVPITSATIQNIEVNPDNVGWSWITEHSHLKGKRSLEVMDYVLTCLEDEGIRYVLDLHYLEPGSGFEGDIPPLWYTDKYTEAQWLKDLETLATRYKGRKAFIGIDLRNEPNGKRCTWGDGDVFTDWRLAVGKAWDRISLINDDIIVWVSILGLESGVGQLAANPPQIPRDRYSITVHEYGPDVWTGNKMFSDKNFPSNMLSIWEQRIGRYMKDFNVNIGEWGGRNGETFGGIGRGGDKDRIWQEMFAYWLKQVGLDHFYWILDYPSTDTGGIYKDAGFSQLFESKARYIRGLVNPLTTYLGDESITEEPSKPDIELPTEPPIIEAPALSFPIGSIIKHKSGSGPSILYIGAGKGEFFTESDELCRLDVDEDRFRQIG